MRMLSLHLVCLYSYFKALSFALQPIFCAAQPPGRLPFLMDLEQNITHRTAEITLNSCADLGLDNVLGGQAIYEFY